jgi:hypothetical protein
MAPNERVECFFVERLPRARVELRRFTFSADDAVQCQAGRGGHDAHVQIGTVPWTEEHWGKGELPTEAEKADPRWPARCDACGYEFRPEDQWQRGTHQLFARVGSIAPAFVLAEVPPGAMWDASWWPAPEDRGPDGRCLVVRLPDGTDWMVDGPASNGGGRWTRTGEAPHVTARPSIATRRYHGFLTDGFLVAC